MKSLVAVLTYRRLHALKSMLAGLEEHCPLYHTVVFEDCGQLDATSHYMKQGRLLVRNEQLMSSECVVDQTAPLSANNPNTRFFLGDRNLGVTGNSNRAIKYFLDGDWDHLCLCNDDLFVTGDFVNYYAKAHLDLEVGMFCFCDFDKASPAISGHPDTYKWATHRWRGYTLKLLPRFTGIMISVTRELVEKIGYFDAEFGKFGEEHCDYTIRARFAGGIRCEGQDVNCLDVEHPFLRHQDVQTSMTGAARVNADREAGVVMQRAAFEYRFRHYHRPFRLVYPTMANGYYGGGIPCRQLEQIGYKLVSALSS